MQPSEIPAFIAQRLRDVASFNGCVGTSDGICIELSPDDPVEWCKYCVQGEAAKIIERACADELAAHLPSTDDLYRLGEWQSIKGLLEDAQIAGDTVYQQVETLLAAPPAQAWQPIESAPKDGTTILVTLNDYNIPSVDFGWHDGQHWRNYEDAALSPLGWMAMPPPLAAATLPQPPSLGRGLDPEGAQPFNLNPVDRNCEHVWGDTFRKGGSVALPMVHECCHCRGQKLAHVCGALHFSAVHGDACPACEEAENALLVHPARTANEPTPAEVVVSALVELVKQSESYVNLTRVRGYDLRPEAADQIRNAIAAAKHALAQKEK